MMTKEFERFNLALEVKTGNSRRPEGHSFKGVRKAHRRTFFLVLGASAVVCAGCSVGPKYHPPSVTLAPFHNAALVEARNDVAPPPALDAWWAGFEDHELIRVVERALNQNLDLAASAARVDQARAAARGAGAGNKPSINLAGDVTTIRQSLESPIGRVATNLPRDQNYYDLGIAASWELDIFGQFRKGAQAASTEAQAAEASHVGTRISIAAEAADAYVQIRGAQARIAFAEEQIQTDEHLLKLIRQRFDAGVSTDREVAQAEALFAQARASVPPIRTLLESQLNRLDVLMGAQPGTYSRELSQNAPIPNPPGIGPSNAPLDVLRRRPDVIAAERRLAASNAAIGGAIAGYYPKVSLFALLGSESIAPGHLFQSVAFQPQSVAGLRWRIFDFGRVSAEIAGAKGANAEALAAYRQSVLHAAEDVEDAFMLLTQSEVRERQVLEEVNSLKRARDRSEESYLVGVLALTDVLDADRQLLIAQDELALTRETSARAAVGSFRALGGGWTP